MSRTVARVTALGDLAMAVRFGQDTDAMPTRKKKRCAWSGTDPPYVAYHDEEWGVPVHDDRLLFEFLVLEGAQAGLSWSTILRKRNAYRRAMLARRWRLPAPISTFCSITTM